MSDDAILFTGRVVSFPIKQVTTFSVFDALTKQICQLIYREIDMEVTKRQNLNSLNLLIGHKTI